MTIAEDEQLATQTEETALSRPSLEVEPTSVSQTGELAMPDTRKKGGPKTTEGFLKVRQNAYGSRDGCGRFAKVVEPPEVTEAIEYWFSWYVETFRLDILMQPKVYQLARQTVIVEMTWVNLWKAGGPLTRKGGKRKALVVHDEETDRLSREFKSMGMDAQGLASVLAKMAASNDLAARAAAMRAGHSDN